MRKLFLLTVCLFSSSLFSYSLWLINDTPFELNVSVHSATGYLLGQDTLKPGEQKLWSSENTKGVTRELNDPTASNTPLSVTWQCSYEGTFSVNQDISPGQPVKASQGMGSRTCKKKPPKEEEPTCPACPDCPPCPTIESKGSAGTSPQPPPSPVAPQK